jgi:hypothetical protein
VTKSIIEAYYDQPPAKSYFGGCSNGGRQGMMAAQRYPHLFDGIVAGAPGLDFPGMIIHGVRKFEAMFPDGDPEHPVLSQERVQELDEAVLALCDATDGLADGIVSDPAACPFEPRRDLSHFSEEELRAIEAIYQPLTLGRRTVHPGYPPGHEALPGAWDLRITGHGRPFPTNYAATEQFVGSILLNDPDLRLSEAPDLATLLTLSTSVARVLNATSPDLRAFREAGGKLIVYHGWADHAVSAYGTTQYHERVVDFFGSSDEVDDFFRVFMLPGMLHCSGGVGPDRADWLSILEMWVEKGRAPDSVRTIMTGADETVTMSRPACPYPQRAVYDGDGSPWAYESFSCAAD